MSARTEVVDLLEAELDPLVWDVLPYAKEEVGNLTKATVMVQTTAIGRVRLSSSSWAATVAVYVLAPYERLDVAEDTVEDGIVTVLNALEAVPNVEIGAERVTLGTHQVFRAQVTYPLKNKEM